MSKDKQFSPGRRRLIVAGGGLLVLGALGASSWGKIASYRASWIESVVRENLPGVQLDPASLQTFVNDMLGSERLQRMEVKATVFADRFVSWLPRHISKARDGLEGLERHVLTEYLIGSNFFRVPNPKSETIVYGGRAVACINPFMYAPDATISQV